MSAKYVSKCTTDAHVTATVQKRAPDVVPLLEGLWLEAVGPASATAAGCLDPGL